MNYTELSTAIQDYSSNYETSFVAHIPDFIRMAEQRIFQEADLPVETQSYVFPVIQGQSTLDLTLAAGYISVDAISLTVSGRIQYLDNKTEEYVRTAYPTTAQGVPRLYNVADTGTVRFAPASNAAYSVDMRYYSYPTSIVTAINTWLGDTFEFALFYGAMREAAAYLKEEVDIIQMYEARYLEALNEVKTFAGTRASLDTYRNRSNGAA